MSLTKTKIYKILYKLSGISYFKGWVIFLSDLLLAIFSIFCALGLVSYYLRWSYDTDSLFEILSYAVIGAGTGAAIFSTYACIIRYSTLREVWRLLCSIVVTCIVFYGLMVCFGDMSSYQTFLLSVVFFLIQFFTVFTARILLLNTYKLLRILVSGQRIRLFIYGTAPESVSLVQSNNKLLQNCIVEGIITFTASDKRFSIDGNTIKHIESEEQFARLIKKKGVETVLFPDIHSLQTEKHRLVEWCNKLKIRVYVVPGFEEMKDGVIPNRIRPIRIEDLLGRDEVEINLQEISGLLKDKVVMVTGAAGSIGSEICRQLAGFGIRELICFDAAETPTHYLRLELEDKYPHLHFIPVVGDVRNKCRLTAIFELYRPQIVFHAAAYKHVPLMEENPCEAIHTNVMGTRHVADLSLQYGVEKFVMISTDKAVNPTNIMGCSKRIAEIYIQSLSLALKRGEIAGSTCFITTRFGNVLGSNGSVIPRFKEEIEQGGPVTVTHPDIIRYFMTIPEACRLVLEAGTMGHGGEIFVFDMGEPVKILHLARRMIELAGYVPDKDIKITFTGLRPGEKLYEELLSDQEQTMATSNKKIRIAQVREYPYEAVHRTVDSLINYAICDKCADMVREMKQFVPEYISENSRFEKLDAELEVEVEKKE